MRKKIMAIFFVAWIFAGTVWAEEGHERASNSVFQIEWGLKGAQETINTHPLFVHFPIALLLTALAFYLLGSIVKREALLAAGKWNLWLGALSAIVTVGTGLQAEETVQHGGETHRMMMVHEYLGFMVLALSLGLSLWVLLSKANLPARGRRLFLVLLVLMGGILAQGADLGGRMVFLNGVGVGKKSMMQEQAQSHETMAVQGEGHGHGDHHH